MIDTEKNSSPGTLKRAGKPEDIANLVAFSVGRSKLHHRSGNSSRRRNGNAVTFGKEVNYNANREIKTNLNR